MEQEREQLDQVEEIDLRQYIDLILKWKWMIILVTIGFILTSYIISAFLLTPIYETSAVLMVTQPNVERIYRDDNGSLESTVDSFSRLPSLNLNTFTGQFKNAQILDNVIKKLNLDQKGYTPKTLAEDITVTGNEDTNVLEVKVANPDPALATTIANTLVDEFYAFLYFSNQSQMKKSVAYLNDQLKQTEEELKNASEMYQEGRSQARNADIVEKELLSKTEILTNSKSLLLESQVELEQLKAGKARLKDSLAGTPAKLVTKKAPSEGNDLPDHSNTGGNVVSEEVNPLYMDLIKSLNEKDMEIAQIQAKITGISNNIILLENEIADLQVELSEKQMAESTAKRKLDTLENAYAVLNEKIIETEIVKSVDFGRINLTMIAPAYHPSSPVKPDKKLNMAIAGILGVMLSVFAAFVLEFFDDTVKTADDLKKLVDVPILASVPNAKN